MLKLAKDRGNLGMEMSGFSFSGGFSHVEEAIIIGVLNQGDQFILPTTQGIHRSFKFSEHIVHVH